MKKETIEKIKSGVIVALVLIIVFGASYFTSELQACDNNGSSSTVTDENDSSNNDSSSGSNTSSDIPESEQADLNEIDIDEYLDLKSDSDASIIYIARPTCYYCQQEEPIVKNIVYEYGVTVNYLNTDELDSDGLADLVQSDDYFSEGFGTPILMVVQDDEIVEVLEGLQERDTIVNFFTEHGFINE